MHKADRRVLSCVFAVATVVVALSALLEPHFLSGSQLLPRVSDAHAGPGRLLCDTPRAFDLHIAVFPSPASNTLSVPSGRSPVAAPAPQAESAGGATFLAAAPGHCPRLIWSKYRRYVCQLLDLPPPL